MNIENTLLRLSIKYLKEEGNYQSFLDWTEDESYFKENVDWHLKDLGVI